MANELSSQTRLTNRFLKNIEQWNEREVNDYKRKVGFELTEAWTEASFLRLCSRFSAMHGLLSQLPFRSR